MSNVTNITNNYCGAPVGGEANRLNGSTVGKTGSVNGTSATTSVNKTSSTNAEGNKTKEAAKPAQKDDGGLLGGIVGFLANMSGGASSPVGMFFGLIGKALTPGKSEAASAAAKPTTGSADTEKRDLPKPATSTIA
jgi:hypothetical protein